MSTIQTNQPNFFGNNGAPLANGYIYIGVANQSPIDNPQTVTFTDSSGISFAATQPLRTNSEGKIQWNGKAITASVSADYSMLIQDSTQTDINGGYIAEISVASSGGSSDLNNYREYQTLLADVKLLTPDVGETVSSIGKLTVTDGLGADWLVVSATGGTADDVDLIDFANGRQGVRLRNNLQGQDNLDTIADAATARTNLGLASLAVQDTIDNTDIDDATIGAEKFQSGAEESVWVESLITNGVSAGSVVCWESNETRTTSSTSYPTLSPIVSDTRQQSVFVLGNGTVTASFSLTNNTVDDDAEAIILKNGVTQATFTVIAEPATESKSANISVAYGDIITFQWRKKLEGSDEGGDISTSNRKIKSDSTIPVFSVGCVI